MPSHSATIATIRAHKGARIIPSPEPGSPHRALVPRPHTAAGTAHTWHSVATLPRTHALAGHALCDGVPTAGNLHHLRLLSLPRNPLVLSKLPRLQNDKADALLQPVALICLDFLQEIEVNVDPSDCRASVHPCTNDGEQFAQGLQLVLVIPTSKQLFDASVNGLVRKEI